VPVPENVEEGLTRVGLTCIAAGVLGSTHKSYFAARLRGSADMVMLELVLKWDAHTVQATFRGASLMSVTAFADHFAAVLGNLLCTPLHLMQST